MKDLTKILMLAILMLIAGDTFSQSIKKEYYDYAKTNLMAEYQVNSVGEKHGWFKGYDQQGVLVMEYNFKNNLWEGTCKDYSTYSGKREISQLETFKQGVLNGPAKYYAIGLVVREGKYLDGERHGDWLDAYPYVNYDLTEEEKKGCTHIKRTITYENGKIIPTKLDSGEITETYYPSGKIRVKTPYFNYKVHGIEKFYFPSGSIEKEDEYDKGQIVSSLTNYPNGQRREFRGTKDGVEAYEQYDKDGTPTRNMENWLKAKKDREDEIIRWIKIKKADSTLLTGSYKEAMDMYIAIKINPYPIETFYEDRVRFYNWEIDGAAYENSPSRIESSYMENSIRTSNYNWKRDIFFDYMKTIIQQDMVLYNELKLLHEKIVEAEKKYKDLYNPELNLRPAIIYEKSFPVISEMLKVYQAEKGFAEKKALGEKLLTVYNTMNELTPEKCKELKKSLKKIEDADQIKTVLGL